MTATKTKPDTALDWNATYPIGTPVIAFPVTRDAGPVLATKTRSIAWTIGAGVVNGVEHFGTPVVAVEGYPGGIALTHVDVIEVGETVPFLHFELTPQRDGDFTVDCKKCDMGMTAPPNFGGVPQATMVSEFVKQHAHKAAAR